MNRLQIVEQAFNDAFKEFPWYVTCKAGLSWDGPLLVIITNGRSAPYFRGVPESALPAVKRFIEVFQVPTHWLMM